jgi:hypothetical protein
VFSAPESLISNNIKAKFLKEIWVSEQHPYSICTRLMIPDLMEEILLKDNDLDFAAACVKKGLYNNISNLMREKSLKSSVVANALMLLAKHCCDLAIKDESVFSRLKGGGFTLNWMIMDTAGKIMSTLYSHEIFERDESLFGIAFQSRRKAYMLGKVASESPTPTQSAQALIDCPDIITQAIDAITQGVREEEKEYA